MECFWAVQPRPIALQRIESPMDRPNINGKTIPFYHLLAHGRGTRCSFRDHSSSARTTGRQEDVHEVWAPGGKRLLPWIEASYKDLSDVILTRSIGTQTTVSAAL
jgi:hypothetical protein